MLTVYMEKMFPPIKVTSQSFPDLAIFFLEHTVWHRKVILSLKSTVSLAKAHFKHYFKFFVPKYTSIWEKPSLNWKDQSR